MSETPRERQIREAMERANSAPGVPQHVAGHPGLTAITVPTTGATSGCDLKVGERVRMRQEFRGPGVEAKFWTGTVASVPAANAPIIQLGGHPLGNEVGVDLDGGGRAVADYDRWERIP
jgi:hypothetical protein